MALVEDLRAGAVQWRSATVEDIDAEKGIVSLKAVPYGSPTDIGAGVVEEFKAGSFAKSVKSAHRLTMWSGHGGPVIGRGTEAEDRADGVWLRMRVGRTQAAKDALLDLEDGIVSDPSIEFRPLREHMTLSQTPDGGLSVVHRRAVLLGVALVPDGAYSGQAFVEYVRESKAEQDRESARLWLAEYRERSL